MKLSKKDLQLVNESIEHWKRDIEAPLLAGKEAQRQINGLKWKSSGELLLCGDDDCPLCIEYGDDDCDNCPLEKANLGRINQSEKSPYGLFWFNPCLETAQAMIKALESLKTGNCI